VKDVSMRLAAAFLILSCVMPAAASPGRTAPGGQEAARPAGQAAAAAALLREAERALAAGPFSVMDKRRVPPSGDKHDFLTLAPYWWPDPAKPDGLPYIRRDGEVNPESKRDTDDVPFGQMTEAVTTLAAAFRGTQDGRFAARAAFLLRVWFLDPSTRMNPNLDYGQGVPGRNTGRGAGIIATRKLVDIVDAARALEASPAWSDRDRQGLHAWCSAYAAWLQTSRNGREEAAASNNHGTWYEAQLTALLLYTGRRDEAKVRCDQARKRLSSQIEPDGRQPRELERTRSWNYSVMNLDGWFTLAGLAQEAGIDLWSFRSADGRSLRAALDYLVPFANGSARWPHKQIAPIEWDGLVPLLDEAAARWNADRYRVLADRLRRAAR
jgi:hypothetical protein